jgi:uncharacterized protein YggE
MNNIFENKKVARGLIIVGILSLSLFFLASANRAMKSEYKDKMPATIIVSGDGEFFAVPDTATFTFSVEKEGVTQKEASDTGATIINTIVDSLKKDYGMSETKDLKTTNLSISPKYEYARPCYGYACPVSNPKIVGYTFSQSLTVKIKDLDKAGEISAKLAEWGATNVYGPDFTLADEDLAKEKARQDAIVDAKVKATTLAKQLGVKLGKIQNFSENAGGGIYPVAYGRDMMVSSSMEKSVAPQLPTGENKYSSVVTITYEIR